MTLQRHFPWALPALCGAGLLFSLKAPPRKGMDIDGFARLPALEGGRVKPLDTIARSSLLMLRGKQTLAAERRSIGAAEWLLDVTARPEAADVYRVFVVDDPDILGMLGKERGAQKYFAYFELEPFLKQIQTEAAGAQRTEGPQRSRFQRAVVNLQERLDLYARLKNTLQIEGTADFPAEIEAYGRAIPEGLKAMRGHRSARGFDRKAFGVLNNYYERYRFLASAAFFWPLPPLEGERPGEWSPLGAGLLQWVNPGRFHPTIMTYARLLGAYRRSDAGEFNAALAEYRRWLESSHPSVAARAGYEVLFNRAQPFYSGMLIYIAALLCVFASWLIWPEMLRRAALRLLLLAFLVHTAGLLFRIVLQGRPPVTNLYSSAIFVGWVAVLLGAALERVHRNGFGIASSASVGFSTLIIAHHMAGQGDTMEMMRAVLDSNFWLATHVVTITIGYGAMFLAALFAHIYIVRELLVPAPDKEASRSLVEMTYGTICFGLFFSFLGTVLGGIWADQSWGRFWGWDPKENGALLIVLWNAIILHARWVGEIRERGLMLCAIFGGILTSLSWFGVNMLGIGLHSYGFMDQAFFALVAFCVAEIAVMGLGAAWVPTPAGAARRR